MKRDLIGVLLWGASEGQAFKQADWLNRLEYHEMSHASQENAVIAQRETLSIICCSLR